MGNPYAKDLCENAPDCGECINCRVRERHDAWWQGFNAGLEVAANSDAILNTLRHYRCQYTYDEDGEHLALLDVLSPGGTVAQGQEEMVLLADEIASGICTMKGGDEG